MKMKLFCLSVALLFAFATVNVASAEAPAAPGCPCVKPAGCPCVSPAAVYPGAYWAPAVVRPCYRLPVVARPYYYPTVAYYPAVTYRVAYAPVVVRPVVRYSYYYPGYYGYYW